MLTEFWKTARRILVQNDELLAESCIYRFMHYSNIVVFSLTLTANESLEDLYELQVYKN